MRTRELHVINTRHVNWTNAAVYVGGALLSVAFWVWILK